MAGQLEFVFGGRYVFKKQVKGFKSVPSMWIYLHGELLSINGGSVLFSVEETRWSNHKKLPLEKLMASKGKTPETYKITMAVSKSHVLATEKEWETFPKKRSHTPGKRPRPFGPLELDFGEQTNLVA